MLHEKFDHFQIWANDAKHVVTRRNRVAKRAQHAATNNMLRRGCYRLARGGATGSRVLSYACKLGIWVLKKDR